MRTVTYYLSFANEAEWARVLPYIRKAFEETNLKLIPNVTVDERLRAERPATSRKQVTN